MSSPLCYEEQMRSEGGKLDRDRKDTPLGHKEVCRYVKGCYWQTKEEVLPITKLSTRRACGWIEKERMILEDCLLKVKKNL